MTGLGDPHHAYVFFTVVLTTYGQLVLKWQMPGSEALPDDLVGKLGFLVGQLRNPWIFSSFVAAAMASLTWMAALTKLELSYAYPFMSLAFVLVLLLSALLLQEGLSASKVVGTTLIALGIIAMSRG